MKVSYKFLSQYVDLSNISPKEIADKLTFAGAEVEEISATAVGTNLIIGEIISCIPHPDSDHLHILQVDEGSKEGVHQIVCGAPNARKGLKVIVARTGAKLAEVEIKPSKIRGVESDGMCCSLLELGVDKKFLNEKQINGIEELPADAKVGEENVLGYLGLDDVILDISILPNRPDLYSLYNVAREVACLFSLPIKPLEYEKVSAIPTKLVVGSETVKCPSFSGRIVRNVVTKESPAWLKSLLTASGIRSINNVVDIGNYVMLVTGQPLNMYDLDKLEDASLIVKDSIETKFLAMDGQEYEIHKNDLCVMNHDSLSCLAGIMTADSARVDESTKNIIVEAAYFDYASIRRTSNRIGLSSDSSLRFAKGINPHNQKEVQEFTAYLLKELAQAKEFEDVVYYDSLKHDPLVIELDKNYINNRLGTSFSNELIKETLERDYFELNEEKDKFLVKVPLYRLDIDGPASLSEEVIRLLGYENVVSILPETKLNVGGLSPKQEKERKIKNYLRSNGLNELITYSLVDPKTNASLDILSSNASVIKLSNPMSVERSELRKNLVPSLLEVARYNVNHQVSSGAIFEVSDVDAISLEGKRLGVVLFGKNSIQGILKEVPYDFFELKGYLVGILSLLGIKNNRYTISAFKDEKEELHPYIAAKVFIGKDLVGYLAKLHPSKEKELDLENVFVMELALDKIFNIQVGQIKANIPPKFPLVYRDVAFLISKNVSFEEIKKDVSKLDSLIKNVDVFDIYEGEHILENFKSMAIRLSLGKEEGTLKEDEINAVFEKVMDHLEKKFSAEIRR